VKPKRPGLYDPFLDEDPTSDQYAPSQELSNFGSQLENGSEETAVEEFDWFAPEHIPETPTEAPPQVVQGVLYRGGKMVLAGGAKAFKTWALIHLGYCVANGLHWWGIPTCKTPVLYLDFELMKFDFEGRIHKIRSRLGNGSFDQIKRIGLRGRTFNHKLWDRLIKITLETGTGLVILDPIYKLYAGCDENSAGDIGMVLGNFEHVAQETGAAITHGHHFAKGNQSAKERGERGSGSGVFIRDPDSSIEMLKHDAGDEFFTVQLVLRSFPPLPDFVVRWNHPLFDRDETGINPSKLKQPQRGFAAKHTVSDLLGLLHPGEAIKKIELKKRANDELGMGKTRFYELLAEASECKKIVPGGIAKTIELCPDFRR
jgi:hypothetical protein